jgi:CBS domain containing-hemolysin-like protein
VRDIMTTRPDVEWIDADDDRATMLAAIRACEHEQMVVGRGSIDEVLGVLAKSDLLDRMLDGGEPDPLALVEEPLILHEATPILKVLEQFKTRPVSMAVVTDEYGTVGGILTRTDLLEAIAGELHEVDDEPDIVERDDGSFLVDGLTAVADVFDRLGIRRWPDERDFNTIAGFALQQFGRIPDIGEHVDWEGWRFEIVDRDGNRIDRMLAAKLPEARDENEDDADTSG